MVKSNFYDLNNFMPKDVLEKNANIIIKEVLSIPEEYMIAWHESNITAGEWLMFPVMLKNIHLPGVENLLPQTTSILKELNCIMSGISVLKAASKINPHDDDIFEDILLSKKTYRTQLGISIPNDCVISVQNSDGIYEDRTWEVGKVLSFDSSKTHKAHNLSDVKRVVLICDFEKVEISDLEYQKLKNYYESIYKLSN